MTGKCWRDPTEANQKPQKLRMGAKGALLSRANLLTPPPLYSIEMEFTTKEQTRGNPLILMQFPPLFLLSDTNC